MIKKIYRRDGTLVPFDKKRIVAALFKAFAEIGKQDMKLVNTLADEVVDILEHHFPKTIPMVEEIQDIVETVLIKGRHEDIAKAYIMYRRKRKELRERKEKNLIENIPYKTIWHTLVWNLDHHCETIDKLNTYIEDKTFPTLVSRAEEKYTQELEYVASLVMQRINNIKLLIICGPSCSGKTTTTERLTHLLKERGVEFISLNIDNYYYNLTRQLKDEYGDYDFEGPYSLDIPLINQHLADLIHNKTIHVPHYNFKTGKREKAKTTLRRKKNQIILIDSLYGIYDKITESVKQSQKYILYLETLSQLRNKSGDFTRWTDVRMLRRMIRDAQFRSYNSIKTVGHWHYVRHGELKNIIPYVDRADYIFDTSLAYELPILKSRLFKYFPKIIDIYKKDSGRQDAYVRAQRVYSLLAQIREYKDNSIVPKNSILREFIGE